MACVSTSLTVKPIKLENRISMTDQIPGKGLSDECGQQSSEQAQQVKSEALCLTRKECS